MLGPAEYELIASKNSYYSAKVRACLQYKRLAYREVGANLQTIRRAKALTGRHFYPIVVCPDGVVLQDSCDIVEGLEERHPERQVVPEDPVLSLVATLIETHADEFLVLLGVPFRWVAPDTSAWAERMFVQICSERVKDATERRRAGEKGARIAASIRSRLRETPTAALPGMKRTLVGILDRLDRHLRDTPFLLGDRPSLADLAMMNAMYGHLYRDPGEISDHIRWNCISLALWIDHMLAAAGESDRGALFLTESFECVLASLGEVFAPTAREVLSQADERLDGCSPGDRAIDVLAVRPNSIDTDGQDVAVRSYVAWKLQRLMDRYRAVPDGVRAEADRIMARAGFLEVCRHRPRWRLEKEGSDLVVTKAAGGS